MPKRKKSATMWSSSSSSLRSSKSSKRRSHQSSSNSSNINMTQAEKIFTDHMVTDSDNPTVATMEGISNFMELLGLDPLEDVRVLVLLWKMKAVAKPAQISKEEWMAACQALQADSVSKYQALIPSLDTGFLDSSEFKEFYKFCFQFNREGTHKTLDKELVVMLLQLVLDGTPYVSKERLCSFCAFLESSSDITRVTMDQWASFWDFCQECGHDFSLYDEATSAWPVLIDDYVEYMEKQSK